LHSARAFISPTMISKSLSLARRAYSLSAVILSVIAFTSRRDFASASGARAWSYFISAAITGAHVMNYSSPEAIMVFCLVVMAHPPG
jgi:hypothetical protein